jgi:Arm domain-containing DNA-binding protein/integrase-like protein
LKGSVFKRCKCPAQYDAKSNRKNCRKNHGTWYYVADVGTDENSNRRQQKKGGFATSDEAEGALNALLARVGEGTFTHDEGQTIAQWLATWIDLKQRAGRRASTLRAYRHHIDDYLVPHLGRIRLRDLRPSHVDRLLREVNDGNRKAATVRRSTRRCAALCRRLNGSDSSRSTRRRTSSCRTRNVRRSHRGSPPNWAPSSTTSERTVSARCTR